MLLVLGLLLDTQAQAKVRTIVFMVSGLVAFIAPVAYLSGRRRYKNFERAISALESHPEEIEEIRVHRGSFHEVPVYKVFVSTRGKTVRFTVSKQQADEIEKLVPEKLHGA